MASEPRSLKLNADPRRLIENNLKIGKYSIRLLSKACVKYPLGRLIVEFYTSAGLFIVRLLRHLPVGIGK